MFILAIADVSTDLLRLADWVFPKLVAVCEMNRVLLNCKDKFVFCARNGVETKINNLSRCILSIIASGDFHSNGYLGLRSCPL